MLDPVFGYDPDTKVGQNPGEETLILHRYRILWNISVDSRLVVAGKEPMLTKEDRFKEFRSWYRKIPPAAVEIGLRRFVADAAISRIPNWSKWRRTRCV